MKRTLRKRWASKRAIVKISVGKNPELSNSLQRFIDYLKARKSKEDSGHSALRGGYCNNIGTNGPWVRFGCRCQGELPCNYDSIDDYTQSLR